MAKLERELNYDFDELLHRIAVSYTHLTLPTN